MKTLKASHTYTRRAFPLRARTRACTWSVRAPKFDFAPLEPFAEKGRRKRRELALRLYCRNLGFHWYQVSRTHVSALARV